jgi:ATP-dependent Lon protease
MPSRLPLFPLNLVLFPGELLPLHIFEPRYRQMLADCLEGDRRFGITPVASPGPGALGCVAKIRGTAPLPDGRSNIVVLGERRFGVRAVIDEGTPYLMAAVEEFCDECGSAPLPAELEELRRLGGELREALGVLADHPGVEPGWAEEVELLSFQVAALIETDLETRTRLLALRSTRERVRALIAHLPGLVTMAQSRAEVHVRARSNGAGHNGADLVDG